MVEEAYGGESSKRNPEKGKGNGVPAQQGSGDRRESTLEVPRWEGEYLPEKA